jgi:hypothetical protein
LSILRLLWVVSNWSFSWLQGDNPPTIHHPAPCQKQHHWRLQRTPCLFSFIPLSNATSRRELLGKCQRLLLNAGRVGT